MALPKWLLANWQFFLATVTALGGALVHPKVRKWFSMVATAIIQPGQLVKQTLKIEAEAERAKEGATYWENSYKELTERLDDMEDRLERTREDYSEKLIALQHTHKLEIVAIENDLKEVRVQAARRKDAMTRLAQDREAAILHIGILEAHILLNGGVIPERPDWQSSGYDVLMPDSLGP